MNTERKCFLYARKSTDTDDMQVQSIDAQLVELRAYAKQNNIIIVDELIEKRTAKIPGRPIFNAMLDRIEAGEVDGILAWHPDRLARNSVDGGKIIYLVDTGVIKCLNFPTYWFEPTPQGKFMLSTSFTQSKYYVDSLSENTKRGQRQKCRLGWYPGVPPIGYTNDLRTKTIVVDKKTSVIVKECFELYADNNSTFGDISRFLEDKNVLTVTQKKKSDDFVKFMLTNPFYRGIFTYSGETWEGKHKQFISQELFDSVQKIIEKRTYNHTSRKRYTWNSQAYCGLLKCENCGQMVTGEHLKRKNKDGSVREYIYYHCSRSHKTIKCKEPAISEVKLDKQISDLLVKYSMPADWARFIREQAAADNEVSARLSDETRTHTQEQLEPIEQKLSTLLDLRLEQEIDKETYLERKKKLQLEKKSLTAILEQNESNPNNTLERIVNWTKRAETLGDVANTGTAREKMIALRNLSDSNAKFGSANVSLGSLSATLKVTSKRSQTGDKVAQKREKIKMPSHWACLIWEIENLPENASDEVRYRSCVRLSHHGWNLFP